jgi:phage tail sheath protein FI
MPKYQSAGVYVREIDQSSFVETSGGSYVGGVIKSAWGPVDDIVLLGSINDYATVFGTPDLYESKYFYASKSILSGTNLYNIVRVVDENAKNATTKQNYSYTVDLTTVVGTFEVGETVSGGTSGATGVIVSIDGDTLSLQEVVGRFVDTETVTGGTSAATGDVSGQPSFDYQIFISNIVGDYEVGETVTGGTSGSTGELIELLKEDDKDYMVLRSEGIFQVGEVLTGGTSAATSTSDSVTQINFFNAGILIKNNTDFEKLASKPFKFIAAYPGEIGNNIGLSICDKDSYANWSYSDLFDTAPDEGEFHIVVIDTVGNFYNSQKDNVLETFAYVTKTPGSIDEQGQVSYYKEVLNTQSAYVYAGDIDFESTDFNTLINLFKGYNDNLAIADGTIVNGYSLLADVDRVRLDYVSMMDYNTTITNSVIANVAEVRKDCIVFASPELSDVQAADPKTDVKTWGDSVTYSSYVFLTSNWLYVLDTFNNTNVWVPDNGEIIRGRCAVDTNQEVWYSQMGYTKGILQNVIQTAWNPDKTARDLLTQASINPVFTEIGTGTLLLGDRTHLSRASYLRQQGVRNMFNSIETSISQFAKSIIGEFNNERTRLEFTLKVTKFMNELLSREAFRDFRVICDSSNNTEQVIAEQGFVALVKVLPNSSVNWVELTFTPVAFSSQLDS